MALQMLAVVFVLYFSARIFADSGCFDKAETSYPDGHTICPKYQRSGYCSIANQFAWMDEYCQRTCGYCQVPPGPEEIHPFQYLTTLLDVNMALYSTTVQIHAENSLEKCLDKCSSLAIVNSCRSVNFEMRQGNNRTCELNNGTKAMYLDQFRARPGFIYYEQSV